MTGASLKGSRPAQISTSAWRGENAWRSIPKRAKSKRLAAVAMNSMAQQAVPNGIGHSELARAQLTNSSNFVTSQFGLPLISFETRFTTPRLSSTSLGLIPLQGTSFPDVEVAHAQDEQEDQHLDQQEPHAQRPARPAEVDRAPGDQEHRLDVEHDEQHRHEVELHGEALVGGAERRHAAFVGGVFEGGRPFGADEVRQPDH